MNLPAASASVAVLVLAWDETLPAARVLVEATAALAPPLDSVVALVPTGPAADALSQEEFLPLEASTAPASPPTASNPLPQLPAETSTPEAEASAVEASAPGPPLPTAPSPANSQPEAVAASVAVAATPFPVAMPAATAAALVAPALVWQEVRVLHLGTKLGTAEPATLSGYLGQGEPSFVWMGAPTVPAAPYLGSLEPTLSAQGALAVAAVAANSAVASALLAATDTAATALVALRALAPPSREAALPAAAEQPALMQPPAYLLDELPAAPDAEPDAAPAPAADEPVPTTEASTTELSEEAGTTDDFFAVDTTPVQAVEPATPALPTPAAPPAPVAEPGFYASTEAAHLAALRPADQVFDAPDLNFQIIQYARMAVPQALDEQPFGVIYAPAWPTWLAAQELRHRSGQPLVLHIAKLAAADEEPLDLAAGWVAELQRQALHRADLILTETPTLAQRLRHELALPAHRVRAVSAADAAAVGQALRTAQRP